MEEIKTENNKNKKVPTNPVKVIRAKCLDCCCDQVEEVRNCNATKCPLFNWRMGKNPFRAKSTRVFTEEEKSEMSERLRKAREPKQIQ